MPLTALFPDDHEKITISQGKVGDCYLLATLDCVANLGMEGRARLKSLFTQSKDGVTVRIPRSEISDNLKIKMVEKRYQYSYDEKNKHDVFFISNAVLNEIDSVRSIGATTNSLAVKILEHLSSYYFVRGWTRSEAVTSLTAHSVIEDRHGMGSTLFVSHLINVETSILDIDKVIKLKSIYPAFPVYVSMNWGEAYEGTTHERHALRVESISKTHSDYHFSLVNPWHNTLTDPPLSKTLIAGKDPSFSIFTMYAHSMKFIKKILLELSDDEANFVVRNQELTTLLKKLQAQQLQFGASESKRVIALYKLMPQIASLYAKLQKTERLKFHDCIYQANGDKDRFISAFLSKITRLEMLAELIQEEVPEQFTAEIVGRCIEARDQNLFILLLSHHVNILGHLMFSTMNPDLFLDALIELETGQKPIDLTRLKSIDAYINAYNRTNPANRLNAKIDPTLISGVRLLSTEAELLEAQCLVRKTIDAVNKQELSFKDITSFTELETRKLTLLAQVQALEDKQLAAACAKLGDKVHEKIQLIFQSKREEIITAATNHVKYLKTAQENIERWIKLFDFSFTFANDFNEESVHRHGRMLLTQLKKLSLDTRLKAAHLALGFSIHPDIDKALRAKTAEITVGVQKRINTLQQAQSLIDFTEKKINEFLVVIPDLTSVAAYQAEQEKQIKLVRALMEDPTVLEAAKQLGAQSHSLLTSAFNAKQQEIRQAVQFKLNGVIETIKKVQTYQTSIRAISFDFSKATTEKEIRGIFLKFLRDMDKIKDIIGADKSLELLPAAQTDLSATCLIHHQFAQEANVIAHNRVIYTKIEKALNDSGFVHALHQIAQRVEATKTMVTMGHPKHAVYEKSGQELLTRVVKAREELLNKPKEGKTSMVQATEKIDAFHRKVLAAITSAAKILNLNVEWQTRLSSLEESTKQIKDSFTGSVTAINSFGFYSPKLKPSPSAIPASQYLGPIDSRTATRMVMTLA